MPLVAVTCTEGWLDPDNAGAPHVMGVFFVSTFGLLATIAWQLRDNSKAEQSRQSSRPPI